MADPGHPVVIISDRVEVHVDQRVEVERRGDVHAHRRLDRHHDAAGAALRARAGLQDVRGVRSDNDGVLGEAEADAGPVDGDVVACGPNASMLSWSRYARSSLPLCTSRRPSDSPATRSSYATETGVAACSPPL